MPYGYQTKDKNGIPHRRWRFMYTDWKGVRKNRTGFESREETERLAIRIADEQFAIKNGYRHAPHSFEECADKEVREFTADYLAWGNCQGGRGGRPWSPVHSRMRKQILEWWMNELKPASMGKLRDIMPEVERALQRLHQAGRTGKTLQNYAETIRSFCRWAARRRFLESDPLCDLAPFDARPKTHRRALTLDEIRMLLDVAPPHRQIVYAVALCSGLRTGELRALDVHDIDLDAMALRLMPEWTRNRKPASQPMPNELMLRLHRYSSSGEPGTLYRGMTKAMRRRLNVPDQPLLFVPTHLGEYFNQDLQKAGVPKVTPEGKLDFHALRVMYVTLVFDVDATVKEGQLLARHSTPDMTMNTYARGRMDRISMVSESVGAQVLRPSGDAP